jgi:hypothetical protein
VDSSTTARGGSLHSVVHLAVCIVVSATFPVNVFLRKNCPLKIEIDDLEGRIEVHVEEGQEAIARQNYTV